MYQFFVWIDEWVYETAWKWIESVFTRVNINKYECKYVFNLSGPISEEPGVLGAGAHVAHLARVGAR